VPYAPYVTSLPWISHYGCYYVVHGDDITSDSSGQDCYRHVKAAGRFLVVKRTPGISTTDLVGRMLLCTKVHFIKSLTSVLAGLEGPGSDDERRTRGEEMSQRIKDYASDETGLRPGSEVWTWSTSGDTRNGEEKGRCVSLARGKAPLPGQHVVYVDGGFDLFSSGHIEFLRLVIKDAEENGRQRGWYEEDARKERLAQHGEDYGPVYVVAGVHDDEVINYWKGVNYPIMNIFERGLCVLQCRVSPLGGYVLCPQLIATTVYPLRYLLSALYPHSLLPFQYPLRYTYSRIPWPNVLHAVQTRSIFGNQRNGHFQGSPGSPLQRRQC
jgi:ethanolamine-phosphate cytidylyltransferase